MLIATKGLGTYCKHNIAYGLYKSEGLTAYIEELIKDECFNTFPIEDGYTDHEWRCINCGNRILQDIIDKGAIEVQFPYNRK